MHHKNDIKLSSKFTDRFINTFEEIKISLSPDRTGHVYRILLEQANRIRDNVYNLHTTNCSKLPETFRHSYLSSCGHIRSQGRDVGGYPRTICHAQYAVVARVRSEHFDCYPQVPPLVKSLENLIQHVRATNVPKIFTAQNHQTKYFPALRLNHQAF